MKELREVSHKNFPYKNRDLSWFDFNVRVLDEAFKKDNPLMERLKFLSITASNLDEFFMVRLYNLIDRVHSGARSKDPAGLTPKQQLEQINEAVHKFVKRQYQCYHKSVRPQLTQNNIFFLKADELSVEQCAYVKSYFERILFPVLTPLAIDKSRPSPLLANRSLNIAVRILQDGKNRFAVIQVPSIISRFLELPTTNGRAFMMLEDIIIANLYKFFHPYQIKAAVLFRLTRDTDIEFLEDTENLLAEVQRTLKKRKRGKPVRLELCKKSDEKTRSFLLKMLNVDKQDVYETSGPIDLSFFARFAQLQGFEHLCFEPLVPQNPPKDFEGEVDIFAAIRKRDRIVHHPYESFEPVVRFVKQAAEDPSVLAIKQTLYRVSGNSPIIGALIKAAENGKQVTVLVELKARFDEENNILWAKKLEASGCHVVYGIEGLKTHCKVLLVVRSEGGMIRRYIHMSTGNYNETTARLYTDISFFTCDEAFCADASTLFNSLTGYSYDPKYDKLIVAPSAVRPFLLKMIKNEIDNAYKGLPNGLTIKVNSLLDEGIIRQLYKASNAGVKIHLIVRGICSLVPGVKNFSENITVTSIVGRFLEHSRIYSFVNGGENRVFLSSADLMPRNLDHRVEVIFPIEDDELLQRLLEILRTVTLDNTNARVQLPDGNYHPVDKRGKTRVNSQELLMKGV